MYLGIDLGTSGVKALLIDADQKAVASGHGKLDVSRPHAGWSEQAPADWITGDGGRHRRTESVASEATRGCQGHRPVRPYAWRDADRQLRQVLRPCMLWNDTRSHAEAANARCRSAFPKDHRQHRISWFHRAQGCLGEEQRAGRFRQDRQGASAEGLFAVMADRRAHFGNVGCGRHVMAGRRRAALVE